VRGGNELGRGQAGAWAGDAGAGAVRSWKAGGLRQFGGGVVRGDSEVEARPGASRAEGDNGAEGDLGWGRTQSKEWAGRRCGLRRAGPADAGVLR
jgi:hypothetical protein